MKRVIMTGATGFVGANLARRLLREGHEVHLLVRREFVPWRIAEILDSVQVHEIDLGDAERCAQVVSGIRPDWVFHLAAHGAYPSQTDLQQIVHTNINGTINLVEGCLKAGFEAFVNTGSSSEYGFKDHAPAEDTLLEPNSYYAVTKAAATLFCCHTAQRYKVHMPTLRLYSVFGPYEEPTRLLPALIVYGLRGELPPLVNPNTARDYIYVEDVCDAFLLTAVERGQELGAVYNVGIGLQTTLAEAVQVARRVLDIPVEPLWGTMAARQWDTDIWVSDCRKMRRILNWQPRYTFEQGFQAMADWFRRNPEMLRFYQGRLKYSAAASR